MSDTVHFVPGGLAMIGYDDKRIKGIPCGAGRKPTTSLVATTVPENVTCSKCLAAMKTKPHSSWHGCCGAADPPCATFEASCQNPANYRHADPGWRFLVTGYGETDFPEVYIVAGENGLRTAYNRLVLGEDGSNPDDAAQREEISDFVKAVQAHDWDEDSVFDAWKFEIGGVKVERVYARQIAERKSETHERRHSDDELRFQWLADNYAYVMVNTPQGMRQMADPTGTGNLRAAIDHATEKAAGLKSEGHNRVHSPIDPESVDGIARRSQGQLPPDALKRPYDGLPCAKCAQPIKEGEQAAGDWIDGRMVVEHAAPSECHRGDSPK